MPRFILIIVVMLVIATATYSVLTMPDRRTTTDKISDAVRDLPKGVDRAGRDLEDRTPGQKLGDMIKDNTEPRH